MAQAETPQYARGSPPSLLHERRPRTTADQSPNPPPVRDGPRYKPLQTSHGLHHSDAAVDAEATAALRARPHNADARNCSAQIAAEVLDASSFLSVLRAPLPPFDIEVVAHDFMCGSEHAPVADEGADGA